MPNEGTAPSLPASDVQLRVPPANVTRVYIGDRKNGDVPLVHLFSAQTNVAVGTSRIGGRVERPPYPGYAKTW